MPFGDSVPAGFFIYPERQAADILAFMPLTVPVGEAQEPMLAQTRAIVRTFNRTYHMHVLVEPVRTFPPMRLGRLPGIAGNAKKRCSQHNGITLAEAAALVQCCIMSM